MVRHGDAIRDLPCDHDRGNGELGCEVEHSTHDLAVERFGIHRTLTRDDEIGVFDGVDQADLVRDDLEPLDQFRADRRQTTRQTAGGPGPIQWSRIQAEIGRIDLAQPVEPPFQQLDLRRRRTLLRSEDPGRVDEAEPHVARHDHFDAPEPNQRLHRPHRAQTAVGGGGTTHAHDDPTSAGSDRFGQKLTGSRSRGGQRIVFLGTASQQQSAGPGHLHHGGSVRQSPRRIDGVAQGTRHQGCAVCATQCLERALSPIGHRPSNHLDRRVEGLGARRHDLERCGGTAELVRTHDHLRRSASLGAHRPILADRARPVTLRSITRTATRGSDNAHMESRPVVVVSNRGPSSFRLVDGEVVPGAPAGGLARGLRPMVARTGGTWIACAVSEADRAAAAVALPDPDLDLRLLAIDPAIYGPAYDTIANGTLWFAHHGLWDLPRRPRFDAAWHQAWNAYRRCNEQVAQATIDAAPRDAVVLVQDYHFALVAPWVAERRPDLSLVHFSHTPFGGPESLAVLPADARQQYLEGMASHAACGFHTERWGRRFEQSCQEYGIEPPPTFVSPLPPDLEGIPALAASPECDAKFAELETRLDGKRLILTSGRLELSKNVQRALFAYEELLIRRPELRGEVVFAAFVYPSREGLVDYQAYRQECEGTAARINSRFGTDEWTPVWFDTDDDLPRSVAGLRSYDALVINPIRDGLNLVAFEGPLVNERDGVVVLSTEAGAHDQLAEAVESVQPFDINDTAAALARALDMAPDQRAARASQLRTIATTRTVDDWFADQLRPLSR